MPCRFAANLRQGLSKSLRALRIVAGEPFREEWQWRKKQIVRFLENFRQNDQKNQELSFRAQREIFCFDGVTNAEDFSLRSE